MYKPDKKTEDAVDRATTDALIAAGTTLNNARVKGREFAPALMWALAAALGRSIGGSVPVDRLDDVIDRLRITIEAGALSVTFPMPGYQWSEAERKSRDARRAKFLEGHAE